MIPLFRLIRRQLQQVFLLLLVPCALSAEKPKRIVTLDTATDSLVLKLVDVDRVVAVRDRSQKPENCTQWEKARMLPGLGREMAEEVYRLSPDIVFFGRWSGRQTRDLLKQVGVKVVRLNTINEWEDVYSNLRAAGGYLGEEDTAEALITEIEQRLAEISGHIAGERRLRAVSYLGRGSTYGAHTKMNFLMESAGLINIAAEQGIEGTGKMPVETLLLSRPDVIIFTDYQKNTPSMSRQILDHPAFHELEGRVIIIELDSAHLNSTDTDLLVCVERLAWQAYPHCFGGGLIGKIDEE